MDDQRPGVGSDSLPSVEAFIEAAHAFCLAAAAGVVVLAHPLAHHRRQAEFVRAWLVTHPEPVVSTDGAGG